MFARCVLCATNHGESLFGQPHNCLLLYNWPFFFFVKFKNKKYTSVKKMYQIIKISLHQFEKNYSNLFLVFRQYL
jgi:hypothetical protein